MIHTRERVSSIGAALQRRKPTARLGERATGTERLEEAIDAYRAALEDRRERVPLDWAATRATLAMPFSAASGRAAPSVWKRLSTPIELPLKSVRASACRSIGLRRRTTGRPSQAGRAGSGSAWKRVDAYPPALEDREERTRERVARLGCDAEQPRRRPSSPGRAGDWHRAPRRGYRRYRAALEERTRRSVPLDWAGRRTTLAMSFRP